MVNSESFETDVDRNVKGKFTLLNDCAESPQSLIYKKVGNVNLCENGFTTQTADSLPISQAIEPTATETDYKCNNMPEISNDSNEIDHKTKQNEPLEKIRRPGIYCSLPLDKLGDVFLAKNSFKDMCLYCDRHFVTTGLKQKHVERCHSIKYNNRRLSARRTVHKSLECMFCDKLNEPDCNLRTLFEHLVVVHPSKYFGCLDCEIRYQNLHLLEKHRIKIHGRIKLTESVHNNDIEISKPQDKTLTVTSDPPIVSNIIPKPYNKNKKIAVLSKKSGIRRCLPITRQSSKLYKKKMDKNSIIQKSFSSKFSTKYKKIVNHSNDNNSNTNRLTFDDVFDKSFFNKVKSNIQENLLHHIDGKLFKNHESENRILSFQKTSQHVEEVNQMSSRGLEPLTSLLTIPQFDYFESQIEYGLKPTLNDEVHYKYFTRLKYQEIIAQNRIERDLSKLDMSTQMAVKTRQQNLLRLKQTDEEISHYTNSDEYKLTAQIEELNAILDKRGPDEDLKEEAIRKVALEKVNNDSSIEASFESFLDVTVILDDVINNVFSTSKGADYNNTEPELPEDRATFLNLVRINPTIPDTNKNETSSNILVELTGEWARSKIYICAVCGVKKLTGKLLVEHKNFFHENIVCQHYEFVGNQGELYRHLSIPSLGKVGELVEGSEEIDLYKKSSSRVCTKCSKVFNCVNDLHRHILECGGDWSWALARKRYRYRRHGARLRKKRRLLVYLQGLRNRKKGESSEKRKYIKKFNGPRTKPSDAETIQRMLANLPAKRARKISPISKDNVKKLSKNKKDLKSNKSSKKSLITQAKTAIKSKILVKNVTSRGRRLLRSNSANLIENKLSIIKSTRHRTRHKESNQVKQIVRRHSLRNLKKDLENTSLNSTRKNKARKTLNNSKVNSVRRNSEPGIATTIPLNQQKLNKSDTDLIPLKKKTETHNVKIGRKKKVSNSTTNLNVLHSVSKAVRPTCLKNNTNSKPVKQKKTVITKIVQVDGSSQNVTTTRKKSTLDKKTTLPITNLTIESNQMPEETKDCDEIKETSKIEIEKINMLVEKVEDVPVPKIKGKIKKQRGLKDCIAMLTSKLQINNSFLENDSIFSLSFTNDAESNLSGRSVSYDSTNSEPLRLGCNETNFDNAVGIDFQQIDLQNNCFTTVKKKKPVKKTTNIKKVDSRVTVDLEEANKDLGHEESTAVDFANNCESKSNLNIENSETKLENYLELDNNLTDTKVPKKSNQGQKRCRKIITKTKSARSDTVTTILKKPQERIKRKYQKRKNLLHTNSTHHNSENFSVSDSIIETETKTQLKTKRGMRIAKNVKKIYKTELETSDELRKEETDDISQTIYLNKNTDISAIDLREGEINSSVIQITSSEETTDSPININKLFKHNNNENEILKKVKGIKQIKRKNVRILGIQKKAKVKKQMLQLGISSLISTDNNEKQANEITFVNRDDLVNSFNEINISSEITSESVTQNVTTNELVENKEEIVNTSDEVFVNNERQLQNMTNTEEKVKKSVFGLSTNKKVKKSFPLDNTYINNSDEISVLTTDEFSNSGKENISTNKKIRRKKLLKLVKGCSNACNKGNINQIATKGSGSNLDFDSEDELPLAQFFKRVEDPFYKYIITIEEVIKQSVEMTKNQTLCNCLIGCFKKATKERKTNANSQLALVNECSAMNCIQLPQIEEIKPSIQQNDAKQDKKIRKKRKTKVQNLHLDEVSRQINIGFPLTVTSLTEQENSCIDINPSKQEMIERLTPIKKRGRKKKNHTLQQQAEFGENEHIPLNTEVPFLLENTTLKLETKLDFIQFKKRRRKKQKLPNLPTLLSPLESTTHNQGDIEINFVETKKRRRRKKKVLLADLPPPELSGPIFAANLQLDISGTDTLQPVQYVPLVKKRGRKPKKEKLSSHPIEQLPINDIELDSDVVIGNNIPNDEIAQAKELFQVDHSPLQIQTASCADINGSSDSRRLAVADGPINSTANINAEQCFNIQSKDESKLPSQDSQLPLQPQLEDSILLESEGINKNEDTKSGILKIKKPRWKNNDCNKVLEKSLTALVPINNLAVLESVANVEDHNALKIVKNSPVTVKKQKRTKKLKQYTQLEYDSSVTKLIMPLENVNNLSGLEVMDNFEEKDTLQNMKKSTVTVKKRKRTKKLKQYTHSETSDANLITPLENILLPVNNLLTLETIENVEEKNALHKLKKQTVSIQKWKRTKKLKHYTQVENETSVENLIMPLENVLFPVKNSPAFESVDNVEENSLFRNVTKPTDIVKKRKRAKKLKDYTQVELETSVASLIMPHENTNIEIVPVKKESDLSFTTIKKRRKRQKAADVFLSSLELSSNGTENYANPTKIPQDIIVVKKRGRKKRQTPELESIHEEDIPLSELIQKSFLSEKTKDIVTSNVVKSKKSMKQTSEEHHENLPQTPPDIETSVTSVLLQDKIEMISDNATKPEIISVDNSSSLEETEISLPQTTDLIGDTNNINSTDDSKSYNEESISSTTADSSLFSETDKIIQTKIPRARKIKKRKAFNKSTRKVHQAVTSSVTINCDICNKIFSRPENFLKHKRTLKHIAKLSALEALEIAQKENSTSFSEISQSTSPQHIALTPEPDQHEIVPDSIMLNLSTSPKSPLKLVDIISDVLIKPVDNLMNLQSRCKSLGERKSFDSFPNGDDFITDTSADVIVEKQISLLENMIEDNRMNFRCSPENDFSSGFGSPKQDISFTHNTNIITSLIKPILSNSLSKAVQYEEISDDSNSSQLRYEEQKSRKALNRDEELFLECCSLLKSSSDNVSDVCKKPTNPPMQFLNRFGLRAMDECDWLEHKQLLPTISDDYCTSNSNPLNLTMNINGFLDKSDGAYFQRPIFEDISTESEASSDSNDCFEQFNEDSFNNGPYVDKHPVLVTTPISPNVECAVIPEEYVEAQEKPDSEDQMTEDQSLPAYEERMSPFLSSPTPPHHLSSEAFSPNAKSTISETSSIHKEENKKFLTKGALKVFEGVRVSIPIANIDMDRILKFSPASKRFEIETALYEIQVEPVTPCEIEPTTHETQIETEPTFSNSFEIELSSKENEKNEIECFAERPSSIDNKPVETVASPEKIEEVSGDKKLKNNKIIKNKCDKLGLKKSLMRSFGNKLGLKVTKRRTIKKTPKVEVIKKSYDIYDFEETQDNVDLFAQSSNSLPVYHRFTNKGQHDKPLKKLNSNKNITKNKCMIMERIFRNALKPKLEDEIKNIPVIHNNELVENYVQNCQKQEIYINRHHKLSEDEMNTLFDKLLDNNKTESSYDAVSEKSIDSKHSRTLKGKKRRATFDDTSDEEFNIKVPPKNKKGNTPDSINMEQELKECIGVASRKSQRSCTSGKQKVLTEYWSSDDSNLTEPLQLPPIPDEPIEQLPQELETPPILEKAKEPKETCSSSSSILCSATRQKRATVDTLYYWSSSSEDEGQGLIEIKSLREEECENEDDRPLQHGWIVGDSPKKLVTMLAHAKGKKVIDSQCVKKAKKKRTSL